MGPAEKMNFVKWLLLRIKRTLIGDGRWQWIEEYRRLIIREKPISIIVTILGGLVWFMVCAFLTLWLVNDKETIFSIMQGVVLSVPAFYIYNWLAALYEIYDTERMATWERLKDQS